jgi:hypothetical protein
MRTLVVISLAIALVTIVGICPVLACPLSEISNSGAHSCCHHSGSQPAPCPPKTTVRICPYFALEKGKVEAAGLYAVSLVPVPAIGPPAALYPAPRILNDERLADFSETFLLNRVLLI